MSLVRPGGEINLIGLGEKLFSEVSLNQTDFQVDRARKTHLLADNLMCTTPLFQRLLRF